MLHTDPPERLPSVRTEYTRSTLLSDRRPTIRVFFFNIVGALHFLLFFQTRGRHKHYTTALTFHIDPGNLDYTAS